MFWLKLRENATYNLKNHFYYFLFFLSTFSSTAETGGTYARYGGDTRAVRR
ncbi:MAG: hypothetical protein ACTSRS_04240 [Candidatus Helarchaeota archaeon]